VGADQAVDGRHHVAGGAVRHAAEAQLPERDLKLQLLVPGGRSHAADEKATVRESRAPCGERERRDMTTGSGTLSAAARCRAATTSRPPEPRADSSNNKAGQARGGGSSGRCATKDPACCAGCGAGAAAAAHPKSRSQTSCCTRLTNWLNCLLICARPPAAPRQPPADRAPGAAPVCLACCSVHRPHASAHAPTRLSLRGRCADPMLQCRRCCGRRRIASTVKKMALIH